MFIEEKKSTIIDLISKIEMKKKVNSSISPMILFAINTVLSLN